MPGGPPPARSAAWPSAASARAVKAPARGPRSGAGAAYSVAFASWRTPASSAGVPYQTMTPRGSTVNARRLAGRAGQDAVNGVLSIMRSVALKLQPGYAQLADAYSSGDHRREESWAFSRDDSDREHSVR